MSYFDQSSSKPSSTCFAGIRKKCSGLPLIWGPPSHDDNDMNGTTHHGKKNDIDDIMAEAWNGLTFEDRQQQQDILHGVRATISEEATFIEESLEELESHLREIKLGSAYELAEDMDHNYVSARQFRVMFLRGNRERGNRYDAKEAARNMLKFFEMKQKLFGNEKLVQDIKLDDLDEGDIAYIKSGLTQLVGRDTAGRQLILNLSGDRPHNVTLQNELRGRWYILCTTLESEETQIKGRVPIVYAVCVRTQSGVRGYLYELAKLSAAIPLYTAAMHECTDYLSEHLSHTVLSTLASWKLRIRFRSHFGSQTECLYQLSTYGIPHTFLALDPETNQISKQRHLRWVEGRFQMERSNLPVPWGMGAPKDTICPTENDVLVASFNKCTNMGNQHLRDTIKELSKAYDRGSKEARKVLVDNAIHSVYQSGGRFLRQNIEDSDAGWKELPKDKIRKLVAQRFRNSYRNRSHKGSDLS